jgi:hypothetical protein
VALLLERMLLERSAAAPTAVVAPSLPAGPRRHLSRLDLVVKLGGGCLARASDFEAALRALAAAPPVLVVPGGGPFADAVRTVDTRLAVADDAAHWMAVLAMDQMAHLIASRLPSAAVVESPGEIEAAVAASRVPVLAPFRWLRQADPLPHTWDVTSDSIAAWIAGAIGATRLVLVKPSGAHGAGLADAWFDRALPPHLAVSMVPADDREGLARALGGETEGASAGRR